MEGMHCWKASHPMGTSSVKWTAQFTGGDSYNPFHILKAHLKGLWVFPVGRSRKKNVKILYEGTT